MNKLLEKLKKVKKTKEGVTLIALVVTILVIIILASVSISVLTGDNGIIKRAKEAKEQTEIASAKEKLQVLYLELFNSKINDQVEIDEYLDYLEENDYPAKTENGKEYVEVDGRIYSLEINQSTEDLLVDYIETGEILGPRIKNIEVTQKTTNSITIETETVRLEDGVYSYYIGTDKENLNKEDTTNQTGTYTFTNLTQNVNYYIKVEVENENGKSDRTIQEIIETVPSATTDTIAYTIRWEDGKATVTVTSKNIKYTVETSLDKENYEAISTRSDLDNGDKVYARLTNGAYAGEEIQINVIDNISPELEIELAETSSKSIKVIANANDNETGLLTSTPYRFYISNSLEGLSSASSEYSGATATYTFNNLDHNTTYYIKVEVEDKAGNKTTKTEEAKTKLIPAAKDTVNREITWNEDNTATISLTTEEDYTIVYRKNSSSMWESYIDAVSIENGEKIYISLSDGVNYGEAYEMLVEDSTGPTVTVSKQTISTNTITVTVEATDSGSGMPSKPLYNYYIREEGGVYELIEENYSSNTYTFTNRKAQTNYDIKVTTTDLIGNVGSGELSVTTNEISYKDGDVTFSSITWENKLAKVTVTNNTQYSMQYKIISEGEQVTTTGTWTTVETVSTVVENLKNNYIVIVRLYDGTNTTTGYATCNINDKTAPTIVEVTGNPTEWQKENVILTINATELESGLADAPYSFDGGKTWQADNTKEYEENTQAIIIQVKDVAENIATYSTINITKIDNTGPNLETQINATSKTVTVDIKSVSDDGVGMNEPVTYKYYIAETEEGLSQAEADQTEATSKTYDSLTQDTTYYIKVEVEDILGNKTEKIEKIATGSLDANSEDLKISDETWESKKASVEITNASDYKMQYQVVKSGVQFDETVNWTETEEKTVPLTNLEHGDTIYARLTDGTNYGAIINKQIKDNSAPTVVEVTGNPTEWQKENVILTINAQDLETGLADAPYSFDGGKTWQADNTKEYEENTQAIIIQVKDAAENITECAPIEINKIDKQGPEITIETNATSTKQIQITVSAKDADSGLKTPTTYTYYIKTTSEQEYTKVEETTETTYKYENLKSDTTYQIKVEAEDNLANIGEGTKDITTKSLLYAKGDIEFSNIIWSNSVATITMTNNQTEYEMEYQIAYGGGEMSENGSWEIAKENPIEINGLKDTDIIYARLTDEVNSSQGYAVLNITNSSKKTYTQEELATETTRESYDILGITTSSTEIRVQIDEQIEGAELYNYYYKTINDDDYTLISTCTYYNDPAVITDIKEGTIYQIKVLVTDEDGITRSQNTATMIALAQAEQNQTYTDNRTYIDNSQEIDVSIAAGTGTIGTGETVKTKAGYTITLPETFKISSIEGENTQTEGTIIIDSSSNEYVWIPVNDAIYDGTTQMPTSSGEASRTYKPMAKESYETYYESLIYTFNGSNSWVQTSSTGLGTSGYKEPSLITNHSEDGYTWKVDMPTGTGYDASSENYQNVLGFESSSDYGKYIANSYTNMITSVDCYGGFYVGRYETTMEEDSSNNIIVGSKADSTVLSLVNWYKLNLYQDSVKYASNPYNNVASVTSSMIWGSQYDAMLNFILKGDDKAKVTAKTGTQKGQVSASKQDSDDKINNIYDLGSNVYEWTGEANGKEYRIYRGGSYDTSTTKTLASKTNDVPTDQGEGIGSRLALYVQSTRDETGPTIEITNISSTSNTITIETSAVDKESGVANYIYYISEDGNVWGSPNTSSSNTYTYKNLKQDTTYYIKVVAQDGSGNLGEENEIQYPTQKLESIASAAIEVVQKTGATGNGKVQLEIKSNYEEYENSGYYIEYQVLDTELGEGETLSEDNWTKGESITSLSNGKIIYATLYDGINRTADQFKYTVADLEEFEYYVDNDGNSTENQTVLYTDEENNTAYIPKGFKVGTTSTINNINNGLVVQDENENEFVWVPVATTLETDTSTTSTQKAMARYQSGYSSSTTKKYYEGILYNFSGTTSTKMSESNLLGKSGAREPSLVTNGADYTWNINLNSAKGINYDTLEIYYRYLGFGATSGVDVFSSYTEFGVYMNEEYTNMVQSVQKYGGFYIGRYETSFKDTTQNKNAIVESKLSQTPISNKTWYADYYYQDSNLNEKNTFYGNTSVTSSMIWGSQWDAVLNWMLEDDSTKEYVTSVTGNHENSVALTGSYSSDFAKNIFDMSSNVGEWTQEASSTAYRNYRGGYCVDASDNSYYNYSASSRINSSRAPTMTYVYAMVNGVSTSKYYLGTRMSLYIKNEEDVSAPDITIESTEAGTNNINIKLTAVDEESGISKYIYTVSLKAFDSAEFTDASIVKTEEVYSGNYTITELTQNTPYYIKIEVINGNGLSSIEYLDSIQTKTLTVEEGAIVLEKVWGETGSGKAYFTIGSSAASLEEEGYYLEYQIGEQGAACVADGTWTKSDTATGLKTGDTVYTRLYDGKNKVAYYYTSNITELETFSDAYTQTTIYEDYDTDENGTSTLVGTAYIPKGFKVSTSSLTKKIENGLVVEDEIGNQYVWVPVANVVYDGSTSFSTTYKPMTRYQSGYSTTTENQYFEGIQYSYSGTTSSVRTTSLTLGASSWREPSLITGSTSNYSWISVAGGGYDAANYSKLSSLGITSPTSMGQYINDDFTKMVQSVKKYGGFYVGRYETSLYTTEGVNSTNGTVVKSVDSQTPMASVDWYKMYLTQDSNYSDNPYNEDSSSVRSSMIWGCQWDAMLNYILEGSDKDKVTAVTGNHSGTRSTTAQYGSDIMNNFFDLSSNVREWTQEAYGVQYRAYRGGFYYVDDTHPSSYRGYATSTLTDYNLRFSSRTLC